MIPKNIIYTYKDHKSGEGFSFPPMYEENLYLLKRFNPEYNYLFFSDNDMHEFIKTNYNDYYGFYKNLPKIIMKTDFFRLLAVYHYGGFYFDMDMRVTKNLDDLLDNKCVFPLEWEMSEEHFNVRHRVKFNNEKHSLTQIGNYGFGSVKNNFFLLEVVRNIIDRFVIIDYYNDHDVLYYTGPDVLNFTFWNTNEKNITTIEGSNSLPFKKRDWGSNQWHKFGDYGEHLLSNSWIEGDKPYYYYGNIESVVIGSTENDDLWLDFIEKSYPIIENVSQKVLPLSENCTDNIAVIIEPRKHKNLEYVIKNVMYFLPENTWGMQIFCGNINYDYVLDICGNYPNIEIVKMDVKNLTNWDYSYLKKSVTFWNKVKGKKQLFFQTDSILRNRNINDFLQYDLVGAPWKWDIQNKVGNSGICIMDKQKSLDVCEKYYNDNDIDDIFFANNFTRENFIVATLEQAKQFSVEAIYYDDPLAIHKPWLWLEKKLVENLLKIY